MSIPLDERLGGYLFHAACQISNAQELAEQLGVDGLAEDLFTLWLELQRVRRGASRPGGLKRYDAHPQSVSQLQEQIEWPLSPRSQTSSS